MSAHQGGEFYFWFPQEIHIHYTESFRDAGDFQAGTLTCDTL